MTAEPLPPEPERKRSILLSPAGIGAMAVVGVGAIVATNGFGVGNRRNCTTSNRIVTTAEQCQATMPGPLCAAAFAQGAAAVGLFQGNSGAWQHVVLRRQADGRYLDPADRVFQEGRACRSSSSSSWGRSGGSYFYYSGSGSSGSSYGSSSSTSVAPSTSQAVQRSGFGSTARSVSFSSGG